MNSEKESTNKMAETSTVRHRYKLGIGLFIWLDILLLALIIITGYYMYSESDTVVTYKSDLCLPCKQLRIHPDDDIEGIEKKGVDGAICCAKDNKNPEALIKNFVDHWLKVELAQDKKDERKFIRYNCIDKEGKPTSKPAIKLVGTTDPQTHHHKQKVHWEDASEATILPDDGSLTHHVDHGFIEIKKAGLYQIYSQIVMEHGVADRNKDNPTSAYRHSVVRIESGMYPNGRARPILKTFNSHCSSKSDKQTVTSYLGGAFQLAEGDRLAVEVHNKTEIVPKSHMNFFGVHML